MAEHANPHIFLGSSGNGIADPIAYRTGAPMLLPFCGQLDAFRHHDNSETFAVGFAQGYVVADFLNSEWNLRNEYDVGATRDPRFQRDPARISAHYFNHHDAMMRLRSGVDFVDRIGRSHQRCIETKRDFGGEKIVVDSFRHAHDLHALFEKLQRDLLRTISANADDGIDSELMRVGDHFVRNVAHDFHAIFNGAVAEGIAAVSSAEDSSATGQNSADIFEGEWPRFFGPDQAVEAVRNANDLPVVLEDGGFNDRADNRIQTGSVSAPGANADSADVRHCGALLVYCELCRCHERRRTAISRRNRNCLGRRGRACRERYPYTSGCWDVDRDVRGVTCGPGCGRRNINRGTVSRHGRIGEVST